MQPLAIAPRVKQRRRSELGLLLVAVVVITLAYLLASLGTRDALPPNALNFIGVIAALALVVHLANRFLAPEADPVMMPVVLMLNGIGFVMIYRLDVSPQMAVDAPWLYQAAWTAQAIQVARCTPGLAGFVFWGFHDHPVPAGITPDPWVRFGWLDATGQPKPVFQAAFDALRAPLDCTAVAQAANAPAGWPLTSTIPFPST